MRRHKPLAIMIARGFSISLADAYAGTLVFCTRLKSASWEQTVSSRLSGRARFSPIGRSSKPDIPLGVAYALWCVFGIFGTLVIGFLAFHQKISRRKRIGIVLLTIGIVCMSLA